MRSRWFHRPILHTATSGIEKRASWLELFYDLIFVAAFIQLGNGLSAHPTPGGFLAFVGTFVPLWVAWSGYTFYVNRFTVDDFTHRTFVLIQMFAVGGMAIGAPSVLDGETAVFSVSAAIAQLMVAIMYLRTLPQVPEARPYIRYWGVVFVIGAVLWFVAAFLPTTWAIALWSVATLTILASPLSRQSRELAERFPIDFEHLGERYGLLTIIVLGESFVKVLGALSQDVAGIQLYLDAGAVLLITCGIWWVYFDDVAGSHIRKGRGRWIIWLYAHLPLQIGVTAVGVAVKKAVHFDWHSPAPEAYRWLLAGSLALVYFGVAAVDSVTERRQAELSDRARVNVRWISAILLLVLAPAGRTMSGGLFLTLLLAINVAQVIFDMMMAPFEEAEHLEIGQKSTAEISREHAAGKRRKKKPRRDVTEAVRKGAPSDLRRDLYFYLIEGSWVRVFATFGAAFLVANVFFAALYTLEPGSIANARPNDFMDAFFFSVQTMSTIGYGTLSPASPYGNAIVAMEAALSVIALAVTTGLVFAKVSRPRASVLFSKPLVLTTMHGKRVLMFRVGNARGNEVVDATIDLTAMMDELTPEGHHFRRLHDLKLMRSRSPMFALSWTVVHEIDEDSPLAKVSWDDPEEHIFGFIASLMGHDGTYGQTVFSRKFYYCEDLRQGERFVDVINELEDGRMMVDYTHFHETAPAETAD